MKVNPAISRMVTAHRVFRTEVEPHAFLRPQFATREKNFISLLPRGNDA